MSKIKLLIVCGFLTATCFAEPTVVDPGYYVEAGGGSDPDSLWGSAGVEGYVADYFSFYAGFFAAGVENITDNGNDCYSGLTLGMRLCVPYRISPYVGAGVATGWSRYSVLADNDGRDNDKDGTIDESGEEDREYEIICSAFPEGGIHIWIDDARRLTLNYRYHVTSEGSSENFWTANLGFLISY